MRTEDIRRMIMEGAARAHGEPAPPASAPPASAPPAPASPGRIPPPSNSVPTPGLNIPPPVFPKPPAARPDAAEAEEHYGPGDPRGLAAAALACGQTPKATAALIGRHEDTVRKWLRRKPFAKVVSRIRNEVVRAAIGKLSEGMLTAAETLIELMKDKDAHVRFKAASKVLELGGEFESEVRQEDDFVEEMRALNERVLSLTGNGNCREATTQSRQPISCEVRQVFGTVK